jgi:hypothetical protein
MDHPIDDDYVNPTPEACDIDYDPSATTQLSVTEHPSDQTESYDPFDRNHLEHDSMEVSVAATEIGTFGVDNPEEWRRKRNIHAGVDGHRGREDNRQKVDTNKLDKRRTAEAVACQFRLAPALREAVVTWVTEADLRGYSRWHGGRLGATCAEVGWRLFDYEHEALDCEWYVEKVEDVTGGTKVMAETETVEVDGEEKERVVREWEEDVTPVDVAGLIKRHFDRRR